MTKLLAAPSMALRFVILACGHAAVRSGTAVRIRPADVQEGHIVIRTKKGGMTKTPVSPALAAVMAIAPEDTTGQQTFVNLLAGRDWKYPATQINKEWNRWKKRCGVRPELTLHDMRRGLARRLYAETGDIRAVQSLLSHQSMQATLHYLDATDRRVSIVDLNAAIARGDSL
jgi:integrase